MNNNINPFTSNHNPVMNNMIQHKDQFNSPSFMSNNLIPNVTHKDNNTDNTETDSSPRKRTRATPEQLNVLEKTFNINPSPNSRIREQLSRELGMSERSIQIWFQNRRAKVKNVAKRSSMLHDETLRMQYYASNAATAACKAAIYHQQQKTGIRDESQLIDPIKSNPDLYYYYYYYYFNQQQQQRQKNQFHPYGHSFNTPITSTSSLPPPPPPPPIPGSISPSDSFRSDPSIWSKKQLYQQRTRAHTIGPYYPNLDYVQPKVLDRGGSVDLNVLESTNYSNLLNSSSFIEDNPSFLSYSPTSFDQPISNWSDLPFYNDPSSIINLNQSTTSTQFFIDQNIQNISIESLQIGSWKRMRFESNDLLCQYNKDKKLFSWCIQDGLSRFKMDIIENSIKSISFNPLSSRSGWSRLKIELKEQDNISFYMSNNQSNWVQCRDYTEEKQATLISIHYLDGPSITLKPELDLLLKENEFLQSITTIA